MATPIVLGDEAKAPMATPTSWSAAKIAVVALGAAAVCGIALGVGLGVGLPNTATQLPQPQVPRALVIVSGGAANSPFTTPWQACQAPQPCNPAGSLFSTCNWKAGSTDSGLREYFLSKGYSVFTSPAFSGLEASVQDPSPGGYVNCAHPPLPQYMTVNNVGDLDSAGYALANFLLYLQRTYGTKEVDIVAHSMGGLFSRGAMRVLRSMGNPLKVRSLSTLGTPWAGVYFSDFIFGDAGMPGVVNRSACQNDTACLGNAQTFTQMAWQEFSIGPDAQANTVYLPHWDMEPANQHVLDDVKVLLFAGGWFKAPQAPWNPNVFPNDGLPSTYSAIAASVTNVTLPRRNVMVNMTFDDNLHSAFFCQMFNQPLIQALTFNPVVYDTIHSVLQTLP